MRKKRDVINEFGIKPKDASILTSSVELATYFEDMMKEKISAKNALTWLRVELLGRLNEIGKSIENTPIKASKLALIVKRIEDGTISGKAAKEVLDFIMENLELDVDEAIDKLGLKQVSDDGAILAIIDEILANNEDKVQEYKSGKDKLFGFFVGQVIK